MDIDKVKEFFQKDRFVHANGIDIVSAGEGTCECAAVIAESHLNAGNVVQGGMIFTIADFAFAVVRPLKGKTLIARAKEISATRKTCLYEVELTDELGTQVAFMTATGYIKGGSIGL